MKLKKAELIVISLLSAALTISLFVHDSLYDDGPRDPLIGSVMMGSIYCGLFFMVFGAIYLLAKTFLIRMIRLIKL